MTNHFKLRENHLMSISTPLSHAQQIRAGEIARGSLVQGALDNLESHIDLDDREKFTALVEFIDLELNVVNGLQGPGNLITVIRDAVAPELHLDALEEDQGERHLLRIPLSHFTSAPCR